VLKSSYGEKKYRLIDTCNVEVPNFLNLNF
jgi:hypothetical protein